MWHLNGPINCLVQAGHRLCKRAVRALVDPQLGGRGKCAPAALRIARPIAQCHNVSGHVNSHAAVGSDGHGCGRLEREAHVDEARAGQLIDPVHRVVPDRVRRRLRADAGRVQQADRVDRRSHRVVAAQPSPDEVWVDVREHEHLAAELVVPDTGHLIVVDDRRGGSGGSGGDGDGVGRNALVVFLKEGCSGNEGSSSVTFSGFGAPSDADEALALVEHLLGEGQEGEEEAEEKK